jgi:hypothetical protein
MTTLKNSKVVKSTKKVGGLIQSGLERVGKTINNLNQIIIATQSGYERGEAIIKEEVATRLLLKGLEIDRDQAIKFYNKRFEKEEIDNEQLKGILKEVNKIYDARDKIYNDRLEILKEDRDQLKSSYNELLAKTYREVSQRKLKQRQAEKTSNKDKANRPKPTEIIGFICSFTNVIISNIAIGNKKIETLVDDTITIIENATTKQDIEKAKLFRNNALIVIAANRKRLTTIQQVIDILNILAPLITPIVTFFKLNPIPSAVPPGVGVPLGTITTISDKTRKLQDVSLLKNVKQRQGVWEAETNPMFLSTLSKGGRLDTRKDLIKDVVQTAENLEQAGAGVVRAIPLRFGGLDKGDAAIFSVGKKPLSNEQVSEMSKIVGDRAAIQHRADGTAVLIPFNSSELKSITAEIQAAMPSFKAKPALSQEGFDRLYYPRSDYVKEGAVAREENLKGQLTQAFDELLKKQGYRE